MTFNSIPFLIFYPCVLLGYFGSRLLPEKIGKVQKIVNVDKEIINKSWDAIRGKEV